MLLAVLRWFANCMAPDMDAGTAPAPEWPPPW
jgi:hypothetical protein